MEKGQLTGILYFQKRYKDIRASYKLLLIQWARTELKERKDLAAGRGRAETGTGGIAAETEGTEEGISNL